MTKKELRTDPETLSENLESLIVMLANRKLGTMRTKQDAYDYIAENVWFTTRRQVLNRFANIDSIKLFHLRQAFGHFQHDEILDAITDLIRYQAQTKQLSFLSDNKK